MRRVSPAALLLDHPCLPEVRISERGPAAVSRQPSDLHRLARSSRLALAVQVLALSSLLAELDLWVGRSAIRGLSVVNDGDGLRAVVAGLPTSLEAAQRRLGGGEDAGRRTRDGVLDAVRSATGLPKEVFRLPLEHDWLTLVPWIRKMARSLPQPLDPVTARSLWMVRWRLPEMPQPGEVAYWSVPDRARAMRLACGVWQHLREEGERVWLQEASPEEAGTAPQAWVGGGGCLIVAGEHTRGDMMAVSRWIARADEGRAIVIGTFPAGWSPPQPTVIDDARLDRHLFITGPGRDRARAEVEIRKGRFRPFSAADAGELTRMTADLFTEGEKKRSGRPRQDGVARVLSLLPEGMPEAMAMALTGLRASEFRRRAQAAGAVCGDGRWRLALSPPMRRDELHREVADLFEQNAGLYHRHRLLAGDDGGEAVSWVMRRSGALQGAEALSVFADVTPEAVPTEVRLALAEAALGELDLTQARRWLAAASPERAAPWTRWLNAIDTPPDVARELAPADEEVMAPRAAAEVALRALEAASLGPHGGEQEAAAALKRCLVRVRGLVRRRLEMSLQLLTDKKRRRNREWRRAVTAGAPVLRRELAHRMAVVMLYEGLHRGSARLLGRVVDEEPAPGKAGLIHLDLGHASLLGGDTAAADLHHLRAYRLLQAAGFQFRTRIALFNMGVSDLDKLEVERARARFAASDNGRPDPYLEAELTRLALAVGDERRFIARVRRLPPCKKVERDGLSEGVAFLCGVEALLRHDVTTAAELLERGGQEGSTWLPLARAVLGEGVSGVDGGADPWGLWLCSRLVIAFVRGDSEAAAALIEESPPNLPSRALAVALCERLVGRQRVIEPAVRTLAASTLAEAGLDGWARSLQTDGGSGAAVMTALGRLLEEGCLGALTSEETEELIGGLGVNGIEVRSRCNNQVLWRAGEGEGCETVESADLSLVALGASPRNRAAWRLLGAAIPLLVDAGQGDPDPEAAATGLYGVSDATRQLRAELTNLAAASVPVTVLGETGVGKEVAARALHRLSGRRGRFVGVNMTAVPAALVESELFGSVRGAYTGADRERSGLAVAAHRGTLFLDEIGDLDLALQAKLLRFLESHEVRPVGSDRVREVDVRIVAATHRDLQKLVRDGAFRADLFYRIASVTVTVAPLRDRRDDIPVLRQLFESQLARRHGGGPLRWSREAEASLLRHDWPGNVRELRSVVEVAAARAQRCIVRAEHLPFDAAGPMAHEGSYEEELNEFRRRLFRSALRRHKGNRSAAARDLGISRQTLLYHIRSLGLTDV